MPEAAALARLQRWMHTVLTHPVSVEAGLVSPEAEREIPTAVLPHVISTKGGLSPAERLDIYHGMYPLRMRDALATDYPGLALHLGEHAFWHLAQDYVAAHPSTSYTLNRLGNHMPVFLETWGHDRGRRLRVDLARLELAMTQVFDEEETEPLGEAAVAAVPAHAWVGARLEPIRALRLVALRTNANAVWTALRKEQRPPRTRHRPSFVAVYRRDYAVRRRQLRRPAFELLSALVAGKALGEAVETVLERHPRLSPGSLSGFASDFMQSGLFTGIALD